MSDMSLNSLLLQTIRASAQESAAVQSSIAEPSLSSAIMRTAEECCRTWSQQGTVFIIGNGGSAAEAQHLAAELVGRFERDNCLAAQALTTDTSILTALANDFSYDEVFERQVRALVKKNDILIAMSTSGNSEGILRAVEQAHNKGALTIGLTGKSGGRLREQCDICLQIPATRTCRIQEGHLTVIHILCELIERMLEAENH